eukprot:1161510-Pelagomonas_calceolata.AAC.8
MVHEGGLETALLSVGSLILAKKTHVLTSQIRAYQCIETHIKFEAIHKEWLGQVMLGHSIGQLHLPDGLGHVLLLAALDTCARGTYR